MNSLCEGNSLSSKAVWNMEDVHLICLLNFSIILYFNMLKYLIKTQEKTKGKNNQHCASLNTQVFAEITEKLNGFHPTCIKPDFLLHCCRFAVSS